MPFRVKFWLSLAASAIMLSACVSVEATKTAAPIPIAAVSPSQPKLVTLMSSDDPQTQLLALALTRSAIANGETAHILLCSGAGDLALKAPPAEALATLKPRDESPASMLRALLTEGAKVEVCAIYLPNRPFGAEALLDGVGVANPMAMAKAFAPRDVRVLSF